MNLSAAQPVLTALTPVFLLIGAGWVAARAGWIGPAAVKDLSNLAFMLLIPALLFRTMSQVHVEQLDLRPIGAYFMATLVWLGGLVAWVGWTRRGVVIALAGVFSNMVMIGITLVDLAYGREGVVTLLTLVSVHALILLTTATVLLEWVVARDAHSSGNHSHAHSLAANQWIAIVGRSIRSTLLHPIPLPIVCGLLFAQTGWSLPTAIDKPLQLLGQAFGPMSLVLVGVTLARTPVGRHWRVALGVSLSKNVALPVLVGLSAWLWGLRDLSLTVMVVAAALPVGANVFLFSQRYGVAHEEVTASMGLSTALALLTLSTVMLLM